VNNPYNFFFFFFFASKGGDVLGVINSLRLEEFTIHRTPPFVLFRFPLVDVFSHFRTLVLILRHFAFPRLIFLGLFPIFRARTGRDVPIVPTGSPPQLWMLIEKLSPKPPIFVFVF